MADLPKLPTGATLNHKEKQMTTNTNANNTNAQNAELVMEYRQTGSQAVFDKLVTGNMGLIYKVAMSLDIDFGIFPMEDVQSEGIIALMDAIRTFDPERGLFSNHAYTRIRYHLMDTMPKYYPVHTKRYSRMTEEERGITRGISIDETDENGNDLADSVYDATEPTTQEIVLAREDRREVVNALATLDNVERTVIEGVANGGTLEELADIIGCSHEHIRKIKRIAVAKVMAYMER